MCRPRSLLTLRFINARLYLDPIRECYEAFVIYNFYMFLVAYLEVPPPPLLPTHRIGS